MSEQKDIGNKKLIEKNNIESEEKFNKLKALFEDIIAEYKQRDKDLKSEHLKQSNKLKIQCEEKLENLKQEHVEHSNKAFFL